MAAALPPLRFELTREPVSPTEQRVLEGDLAAQGLDHRYWAAMNGLLSTSSRSDTPLVLRARRGDRLAAVAHLLECRRTNRCLFPGLLGRLLDAVPLPAYYWTRGDAAVDLLGSPGFVADGEDRERFYEEAVEFLNIRYQSGIVQEQAGSRPAAPCYEVPIMDWGRYQVTSGGTDALIGRHKHLRRKLSTFRKKGGAIEVVAGALGDVDCERVLHCLAQSASGAPLRAPFQENYPNMVRWATASGTTGIIHILARLEGTVAGYHSYLRTGTRLQCLSGGFDRTRHTTHHAYENILLETMRYAESDGVRDVAFGPVGNPTKAALMPDVAPFVIRFYSRYQALRRLMAFVVPRSALGRAALPRHAIEPADGHAGDRTHDLDPREPSRPLQQT